MTEHQSQTTLIKNKPGTATKLMSKPSLHKKSKLSLRGASAELFQKSVAESIQEQKHKAHNGRPKIDYKKELIFLFFNYMLEDIIEQRDPVQAAKEEEGAGSFLSEPNSYMILVDGQPAPILQNSGASVVRKSQSISSLSWIVEQEKTTETIIFKNGNIYEGNTFRGIMDGVGTFRWSAGTVYKGEFKNGYPTGKGKMILPDLNTYDGDLCQGYFHGSGVLYLSNCLKFYKGSWKSGKRQGKGWVEYGMNDSYVGDWFEDTRHGKGYRMYKNGAGYKGQWSENYKHGIGSMVFENGDYYTGEWQQDKPHGYGEYTWNMFLNRTLTFPICNMYKGNWNMGIRNGVGMLYFGTECGSKLAGTWRNNHKHGPGVIVCGNGRIIEYCPLFTKDKPAHKDKEKIRRLQIELSETEEVLPLSYDNSFSDIAEAIHSKVPMTDFPRKILQNIVMGIVAPEKNRLSSARFIKFPEQVGEGKKSYSPINISIHCVTENVELTYFVNEIFRYLHSFRDSFSFSHCNEADSDVSMGFIKNMNRKLTNDYPVEKYKETKLLQNMITVYLPQLRRVYERYATITVKGEHTLNFKPVMVRLFLWQLLRDINIQRFISLVDYDNFMYANPCSCYEYGPHYPFEHIYFWQFLQCLVAAAWKYYLSRSMNPGDVSMADVVAPEAAVIELGTGLISKVFKRFLQHVVIPNSGSIKGTALTKYKDLAPLDGAYNLYLSLGEPHTVNMFLYSSCPKEGVQIPCYIGIQPDCEPIREGFNAALLGDKPSYIDVKCNHLDKIIEKDRCHSPERSKSSDEFYRSLYAFRNLGRPTILKCIRKVCPMVDKRKSFNYKLTFLEFYEILFECVHCKVDLLKEAERENLKRRLIEQVIHKSPSDCASLSKGSRVFNKGKKGKGSSRKSLQI